MAESLGAKRQLSRVRVDGFEADGRGVERVVIRLVGSVWVDGLEVDGRSVVRVADSASWVGVGGWIRGRWVRYGDGGDSASWAGVCGEVWALFG